jgi:antitoxin component YwqK of YwqJK toxin-antitoxin module
MRRLIAFPLLLLVNAAFGQPDSLYIASGDTVFTYAVVYEPEQAVEQYTRIGRYAHAPEQVAVRLGYRMGKPSGIYRAYYPDGRPLIFAVYGWGKLHGDWTEYDEFGRITVKGQYRDGLRDGTWSFRQLGVVGHYKEGLKHGKWKTYENGKLARIEKFYKGNPVQGGKYTIK